MAVVVKVLVVVGVVAVKEEGDEEGVASVLLLEGLVSVTVVLAGGGSGVGVLSDVVVGSSDDLDVLDGPVVEEALWVI